MSNSLRDALLKSGLAKPGKAQTGRNSGTGKRRSGRPPAPPRQASDEEIDLARAYALRARTEKREREQARLEAERKAREKKARRQRLQALLDGKSLLREDADQLRHYEFHGKIRRVHVTGEQLEALNAGTLGVVQSGGRFLLVEAAVARQAAGIEPGCVALLIDPDAPERGDDLPADPLG